MEVYFKVLYIQLSKIEFLLKVDKNHQKWSELIISQRNMFKCSNKTSKYSLFEWNGFSDRSLSREFIN